MQTQETITKISHQCDYCQSKQAPNGLRYIIEEISENGVRFFEEKKVVKNFEMRHRTGRKLLDFCSKVCAVKYLTQSMNIFLEEVKPIKG